MGYRCARTNATQGLLTLHTPPGAARPTPATPCTRDGPIGARHHPPHAREGGRLKGNACAPPTNPDKQEHPAPDPPSTQASPPPGKRSPSSQPGENKPQPPAKGSVPATRERRRNGNRPPPTSDPANPAR
eukprot:1187294-Prorocentrum_minimum.AAC.2